MVTVRDATVVINRFLDFRDGSWEPELFTGCVNYGGGMSSEGEPHIGRLQSLQLTNTSSTTYVNILLGTTSCLLAGYLVSGDTYSCNYHTCGLACLKNWLGKYHSFKVFFLYFLNAINILQKACRFMYYQDFYRCHLAISFPHKSFNTYRYL